MRSGNVVVSLNESRAITGVADVLYSFLPGSGDVRWKRHETFGTVAARVGVGAFWVNGSKRAAINTLLSQTLDRRRHLFEPLIVEIVRAGLIYRTKQGRPITTTEIDDLNGHILELGFRFPDLWDTEFRASLAQITTERAREHVKQADATHAQRSERAQRSHILTALKDEFLDLCMEDDRSKAGLALEQLLNRLFAVFDLHPRLPFRVVGEQIDGSFELDGEIYLVEAKWEKQALPEAELLVLRGKIEGKSSFTRGLFIALNGVSVEAQDAITRGKAPSFFVMNGHDLMMILDEVVSPIDFLRKRVRMLAEEGRVCIPFHELDF